MDKIRIDSAEHLIDDSEDCKHKYKTPVFICDDNTLLKIARVHDNAAQYLFDIGKHTLRGRACFSDNTINGLYMVEGVAIFKVQYLI